MFFNTHFQVNVNNSTLEIASRDFANFGFEGSRIFEKIMSDNFNSETRHTDFTQTDIAAQMINTFTSDHTGGKIQNFVTPDIFKTNAQFLILNTINLNSNWKLPFRADRIRNRDFSTATEIIVQNDRFYVIIILPDDVTGLDTIVEDMAVQDILDIMNLMDADASQLVDAYIPQLNIKEDVSMTDTLSRLQLNSLFNNGASLCGISMNGTYVADVSHRAELVIDGNGINLAAATLATESKKDVYSACPVSSYPLFGNRLAASKNVIQALPELTVFNANHPFLAFVIDGNSKLPLFSARVLDPSQS
ncbi:hypothetical protein C0J52_13497 [Blattella germanica]|nr:hypothetical protein C0J52_13497 [Blattella germanica]